MYSLVCGLTAYRSTYNSPLTTSVDELLFRIKESGFQQCYVDRMLHFMKAVYKPLVEVELDAAQRHALNMTQLSSLFYLYVAGMFFGLVVFVVEIWLNRIYVLYVI